MVLEKVIDSEKFKEAVIIYLNNYLIGEQTDEITKKLLGLTKKWKTTIEMNKIETFKNLCKSIETDPKSKLPWTVHEIKDATQTFSKIISKIGIDDK